MGASDVDELLTNEISANIGNVSAGRLPASIRAALDGGRQGLSLGCTGTGGACTGIAVIIPLPVCWIAGNPTLEGWFSAISKPILQINVHFPAFMLYTVGTHLHRSKLKMCSV